MERILNIDDAKKRLDRSISYYESRIEAWEKVKRVTKKDGKNFAILSKNFTNCTITSDYRNFKIEVNVFNAFELHTTDYIDLCGNIYNNQEPADTPEKIEKKINELIEKYKKWLKESQEGRETIESRLTAITPELEKLKQAIKDGEPVHANYIIGSYIKNYLRILND